MTRKFLVMETIVREFEVEAENADDAYEKVMNDGTLEYSDESQGVSQIIDISTNHETIY